MRTWASLLILPLAVCACEPSPQADIGGEAAAGGSAPWSSGRAEGFHIVDCLLTSGPSFRLPGGTPISSLSRLVRTTADDCADRHGRYIIFEPENFAALLDVRLPKAGAGDVESQMYVGDIYARGVDGKPDYIKAAQWYGEAAAQDYGPAKVKLGFLAKEGRGVAKNQRLADDLLTSGSGIRIINAIQPKQAEDSAARDEKLDAIDRIERQLEARLAEIETRQEELASREADLDAVRARLAEERDRAGSDRAEVDRLRATVSRLEDTLRIVESRLADGRESLRQQSEALPDDQASGISPALLDQLRSFDFGNYYAMVIGNGSYPNHQDGALASAVNDAKAVEKLLREQYGYRVTSRHDATRRQILNAFRILKEELGPNDNLLVYYAGHGAYENDQGYWHGVDYGDDPNAAIPTEEITGILRSMKAKHVMVIADSCYAGALAGVSMRLPDELARQPDSTWVKVSANRTIRLAMTSGGLKPVLDSDDGKHSIFAKAFLNELGTNGDVMRGAKLFFTIAAHVQEAAKTFGIAQEPTYSPIKGGEDIGWDYFFVPAPATGADES